MLTACRGLVYRMTMSARHGVRTTAVTYSHTLLTFNNSFKWTHLPIDRGFTAGEGRGARTRNERERDRERTTKRTVDNLRGIEEEERWWRNKNERGTTRPLVNLNYLLRLASYGLACAIAYGRVRTYLADCIVRNSKILRRKKIEANDM